MRKEMLAVGLALTLVATAFGASAFTSASVSNDASMNVVSDDKALIGLTDNSNGDIIDQEASGSLQIDFDKLPANGFNSNATVVFGDTTRNGPGDSFNSAFNITNNANTERNMTFTYANSSDDGNSKANVKFLLYGGSSGDIVDENVTDESSNSASFDVPSNETVYVDLVVNTTGVTNDTSYNGTVKVESAPVR